MSDRKKQDFKVQLLDKLLFLQLKQVAQAQATEIQDRKIMNLTYKCSLEEVTYLLLNGELPNLQQHDELKSLIQQKRQIPQQIEKKMIDEKTFIRILTFIVLSAYSLVYYILYDELQDGEDRLLNKYQEQIDEICFRIHYTFQK